MLATLASPANAFKIINTTEPVGAFTEDRHTGIMGVFGKEPQMIPVTLRIHGTMHPKEFHYEVLNNGKITPVAMMATVFSALQGVNEYGEDTTYRMEGKIKVNSYPDVRLNDMFAPVDGGQPTGVLIALSMGKASAGSSIIPMKYPTSAAWTSISTWSRAPGCQAGSARTDVSEARPGDEIEVEAVLRPYRGERIVRRIPVRVPTSTPQRSAAHPGQRGRHRWTAWPRQHVFWPPDGPRIHHHRAQPRPRQRSALRVRCSRPILKPWSRTR